MKRCFGCGKTAPIFMALLLVLLLAPQAWTYTIQQAWVRVSGVAAEALSTGDIVAIKDADGLVYKADADSATLRPAIGIIGKGGSIGDTVEIIMVGRVSGWTSMSEGALTYLSGTAGEATQVAPSWIQPVGVAYNATDVYFNFSNYFDSSGVTALGVLAGTAPIVVEGDNADAYEQTVAFEEPTADGTATVPNVTGIFAMQAGLGAVKSYTLDTDNVVLTAADCGSVHAIATDAKSYTLPATIKGCPFTFINAGAAGNNIVTVDPAAADQIFGTVTLASSVVTVAGAAGEAVVNTKASSTRGNSITLVGDGVDGWYILGSTGIWAEETP